MLTGDTFLVKERVGALKLTDHYDVFDPATEALVAVAKEEPPAWAKYLRLVVAKHLLPTCVNVRDGSGQLLFAIRRAGVLFRAKVIVSDAAGASLGYFKSRLLSIGGAFGVYNMRDEQIAELKGDWKGWNFKFLAPNKQEIGTVTKKWAGIGKELFTSADNYIVAISPGVVQNDATRMLLLAAALAIDIVFKENKG